MKIRLRLNNLYRCPHTEFIGNSKGHYSRVTLTPGDYKEYDSERIDDVFIENINKLKTRDILYTVQNEQIARENNIEYKIVKCASCGGRVEKMEINPFILEVL